jgi:tRNA (guanine37-N1)-methyltransferase
MVFVDTILRLLPGAIDAESTAEESFTAGLLEYPQYTRPPEFGGVTVPAVLTSGHHEAVRKWRLKEALRRTASRRPELLQGRPMNREESKLLAELHAETHAETPESRSAEAGEVGQNAAATQAGRPASPAHHLD